MLDHPGVQVETKVSVSDFAYADGIELLSNKNKKMQGLLGTD